MFHAETEDMLPRMAPKPSADAPIGATDGILRPQVPEVSILFGQPDFKLHQQTLNTASQDNNTFPKQTYAAWKKQMLPKVSYPAPVNMADRQLQESNMPQDYNNPITNLYPMRSTAAQPLNMAANVNLNGYVGNSGGVTNEITYRRSLESCGNNLYQQLRHSSALPSQAPCMHLPNTKSSDVLTLCAGTQTDAIAADSCHLQHVQLEPMINLASRKDVENIQKILDEVRIEQKRLLKMIETFLFSYHSQMAMKPQYRDIGVQVDCMESVDSAGGDIVPTIDNEQVPKNKFLQHLKPATTILPTPRNKPIAQSTAYRLCSPQFQHIQQDLIEAGDISHQQVSNKPSSASDTSLAMNELALKYLPNEKLAELLKELNLDCAIADKNVPATPVRATVDKYEKASPDISNASYKYLKKYRLLPEDHDSGNNNNNNSNSNNNNMDGGVIENSDRNQLLQCNEPQYGSTRKIPISQGQTPTNKCSPYTRRLPISPLARDSLHPHLQSDMPQHNVNLENIKHQPKFL